MDFSGLIADFCRDIAARIIVLADDLDAARQPNPQPGPPAPPNPPQPQPDVPGLAALDRVLTEATAGYAQGTVALGTIANNLYGEAGNDVKSRATAAAVAISLRPQWAGISATTRAHRLWAAFNVISYADQTATVRAIYAHNY